MRKTFLIFFITIFSFQAFPQDARFDSISTAGIKQIYNIQFEEAETTFRRLIADYPEKPAGKFFLAMIDWWRILLDLENESYDDLFFQKLEDVIHECNLILKRDKNNLDALFFKGGSIGFRGRLRAIRESWIKAADDGREALPIVQSASKIDPENRDVMLGFGIYNYYADVIPNEYPLLKPLMIFFPGGNKEQGISQLRDVAFNGKYAKYEARYFLMTLYYTYEKDNFKAEEFAKLLTDDFPNNPTFERWRGRIAVRRGDNWTAKDVFSGVLRKIEEGYPGYSASAKREASYYVALFHFNSREADSALYYFKMCEENSLTLDKKEMSGFYINTILYLGMTYDLLGERNKAEEYYRKVLSVKEYGTSHAFAKQYLESPYR